MHPASHPGAEELLQHVLSLVSGRLFVAGPDGMLVREIDGSAPRGGNELSSALGSGFSLRRGAQTRFSPSDLAGFLQKPFSSEQLAEMLREVLNPGQ